MKHLKRLVRARRDDAASLYESSVDLARSEKLDEAREKLLEALRAGPADGSLCFQIGNSLEALGDHESALKSYHLAVSLCDRNQGIAALRRIAKIELDLGRPRRGLGALRDAMRRSQYAPEDCCSLARAMESAGQAENAITYYYMATRKAPHDLEAHRSLASLLSSVGYHASAVRVWRHIAQLSPGDAASLTALGVELSKFGANDAAIEVLVRVTELAPRTASAYADLGIAYVQASQPEAAIKALKTAIRLDPRSALAYMNLGVALMATGQAEQAMGVFYQVISLESDWPAAHYNLGLALRELGDLRGAKEALERAASLAPGDSEITFALRRVTLEELQPEGVSVAPRGTAPSTTAAAMNGDIAKFPLADVLEFLRVKRAEGRLNLNGTSGEASIWLRSGDLVAADADGILDLGRRLVAIEAITEDDLEMALEGAESPDGRSVSAQLLEDGVVSDQDLGRAVWDEVLTVLEVVLQWGDGSFEFIEDDVPEGFQLLPCTVDARRAVMEVMTKLDEKRAGRRME